MTFEEALEEMRQGGRVRRPGWVLGLSSVSVDVHLTARDLLAEDWETYIDGIDLAERWERQAEETDSYHPAATATLRRCARELRAQRPMQPEDLPTVAEVREHLRVLIEQATYRGLTERAMVLRQIRDALVLADREAT